MPPIRSLHHVTATVDDAQQDLDFIGGDLGLRLVKQTVNFDNHGVYHFYYGDAIGTPGTLWTTFPYREQGVPVGVHGAGQVVATAFSVPPEALGYWRARLRQAGVEVEDAPRLDEDGVAFRDPSGLVLELVAGTQDTRAGWAGGGVEEEHGVRGLHSVTLCLASPERTVELLTGVLGFELERADGDRMRLTVGGGGPGRSVDLLIRPDAIPARNGLGTVHHVAFAIDGEEAQRVLREALLQRGLRVTEVRDRHYFRSIYFREPGGVLFEVATVRPGFLVDEDESALGSRLRLPPGEEAGREAIEAILPRIRLPLHREGTR
jgi:glyoxalase family protein